MRRGTQRKPRNQADSGRREPAETVDPEGLERILRPLTEGALEARDRLHDFVLRAGMAVLMETFASEAEAIVGTKSRKIAGREAHHWGRTRTEMSLGGRRVVLERPRVRSTGGQEVALPSVERYKKRDPLRERVMTQLLSNVSTRRYERSLEPIPEPVRSRSTSKSAVSRTFVAATERRVREALSEPLGGLTIAAMILDGIVVDGESVVVAMGLDQEGVKHALGLRHGSTENSIVCTEMLQDLLARGLKIDGTTLCMIDGGKGLRKALRDVFGDLIVVQRCQVHKMRNVAEQLPEARRAWVLAQMRDAYSATSQQSARRKLQALVAWLKRNGHEDAGDSLREGLEETITVLGFGLPDRLRRSLATTNAIENLMSTIRRTTARVSRWRDGRMIRRWVGTAVLEAQKRFRKIKGYRAMPTLMEALQRFHQNTPVAGKAKVA